MRGCVVVAVVLSLALAPSALAEVKAQQLEMKTGEATLVVQNHDGKPLADAAVKVLDAADEVIGKAQTNEKGQCTLTLKAGSYKMVVAGSTAVSFSVNDKATVSTLLVVLPAPEKYAAGDAKPAFQMPSLLVFIIGAVAVAIAVPLALAGGGGGGGGHPASE